MPDSRLVEYIKKQLDNNAGTATIKANLKKVGWKDKDINEALEAAKTHGIPSPEKKAKGAIAQKEAKAEAKKYGVLERIALLIIHPKKYFEEIKNESDFWEPMKFQFVFWLWLTLVMTIMFFFADNLLTPLRGTMPFFEVMPFIFPLLFLIIMIVIGFPSLLLAVGYQHLFFKWFGGKGNYVQTLKASSYAGAPLYLLSWIPFPLLGFASLIWNMVLYFIGLSELHEISVGRAVLAWFVSVIAIIAVIVLLWFLFFGVIFGSLFFRGY